MSNRLKVDDRFTIEMAPPTAGRVGVLARRHGLEYVSIPVSPQGMNGSVADRFDREVSPLPRPVAVHCASGTRAGLFTLMPVARAEGLSGDEAVAKAEAPRRVGGTSFQGVPA